MPCAGAAARSICHEACFHFSNRGDVFLIPENLRSVENFDHSFEIAEQGIAMPEPAGRSPK
jgi:hypothetical protein